MLATKPRCKILGRASVADALRQNLLRLARVLRRFILEPYARRRRRRVAIAQLRSLDDHLLADIGLTSGQRRAQGKECPEWRDWRRGWDSNPRYGLSPYNGLANRRLQPLGHPSAKPQLGTAGQAVKPLPQRPRQRQARAKGRPGRSTSARDRTGPPPGSGWHGRAARPTGCHARAEDAVHRRPRRTPRPPPGRRRGHRAGP
jgi:uncharacterized protein YjiS (DUF1127 family)